MAKSTVEEIRARFDADIERFSNLETGQVAAMDARECLERIVQTAVAATPNATDLLDLGCGAGNWSLRLLQELPGLRCTLVDLSQPMLDRAEQRLLAAGAAAPTCMQRDVRSLQYAADSFDLIVAGVVLHHLRTDAEWRDVFEAVYHWLRPGGSFWIYDLVEPELPAARASARKEYSDYLVGLRGATYRDEVFAYIEKEDTPRSVTFQTDLLRRVGFASVDVLHLRACFAAFGAAKASPA